MYTANEVAHIIADLFGDNCACNFNGIDEWLPQYCEVIQSCPEPYGAACWEQYLKYRDKQPKDEKAMQVTYCIEESIKAQRDYCDRNNLPHFAPFDGFCFRCGKNIYQENGISVEQSVSKLITSCPWCRMSYCD